MIRTGDLRERLTLQSVTPVRQAGGAYVPTIADVATVWARVSALSGFERQRALANGAVRPFDVQIRYRDGVHAGLRLLWNDRGAERVLNVTSVQDPDGRRAELILQADEAPPPPPTPVA